MQESLRKKVALSRGTTLFSYFGLILFLTAWHLVISPPATANPYIVWGFQCLPLALFFPVIMKHHLRGHIWLCFFLTVYFMHAVTIAMSGHSTAWLGMIESLLVTTLFTGAMMYARWKSKLMKLEQ